MLNILPNYKKKRECGVVNLDNDKGPGTHWVCYGEKSKIFPGIEIGQEKSKIFHQSWYFDSYGLPPPREIIKYLGNGFIYSTFNINRKSFISVDIFVFIFYIELWGEESNLKI